ncbi:MAG: 50S ribosomal protein L1 [Alphaproteobacteria bacterium]|nr:MAG: 50S ribosomal protein L1 [Alphaproteobacteria bacterium]
MTMGKRIKSIREKLPHSEVSLRDAVVSIKDSASAKFDESIEIAMGLSLDTRKSDQTIRGMVSLPNGTGRTVRVAVFAQDEKAKEAKAAGADIVGSDDLVKMIKEGKINFDLCVATPDMMGMVGQVAKVLGPKGLMPTPKLGTVTQDVAAAVSLAKKGQAEFRADKSGIVHAGVGKKSFSVESLIENIKAFASAVVKAKPAGVKGSFLKSVHLSSTMGGSVKVLLAEVK